MSKTEKLHSYVHSENYRYECVESKIYIYINWQICPLEYNEIRKNK